MGVGPTHTQDLGTWRVWTLLSLFPVMPWAGSLYGLGFLICTWSLPRSISSQAVLASHHHASLIHHSECQQQGREAVTAFAFHKTFDSLPETYHEKKLSLVNRRKNQLTVLTEINIPEKVLQ